MAKGAKEVIQKKRKDAFYQDYIASMLAEAQSLGITKQELVQTAGDTILKFIGKVS